MNDITIISIQPDGVKSMNICVCVGSSCHLKGAYEVVKKLQTLAKEGTVSTEICASFCNGLCTEGVVISIDGVIYTLVSPDNVEAVLAEHTRGGNRGE